MTRIVVCCLLFVLYVYTHRYAILRSTASTGSSLCTIRSINSGRRRCMSRRIIGTHRIRDPRPQISGELGIPGPKTTEIWGSPVPKSQENWGLSRHKMSYLKIVRRTDYGSQIWSGTKYGCHIWSYRTECGCHIRSHHAILCPPEDQMSHPYSVR